MAERICSIPGCGKKHCAKGYCRPHYFELVYTFPAKPCRVDGCDRMTDVKTADGLCEMHYARLRRNGTVDDGRYFKPWLTPAEMLHERSELYGDCVLWTGYVNSDGYGRVGIDRWGDGGPHRFSWIIANGPIPDGLTIDHLCHTNDPTCVEQPCHHRRCLNPDHMEVVTQSENSRRRNHRVA